MILRGRLRFVSLPPAPRGTLRSPWLALVYPASARMLSQPYAAALHSAPLAGHYRPGRRLLPLSGLLVRCTTIGSIPRTR
jgi:hypothetical protein